jgi:predicted aspartyl protease
MVPAHVSIFGSDLPRNSTAVPFRIHEHLIIVQGTVGELEDLNLAMDTGSTYTVLSKRVGKKLGLKGETIQVPAFGRQVKMKRVTLDQLAFGGMEFERVEARLTDLPAVEGLQLDGLIGLDVLKRATVTLDFEKRELTLGYARKPAHSTRFYSGLPFIPVTMTVDGKSLRLSLDTGACGVTLYESAVKGRFPVRRTGQVEIRGQVGGKLKMEEVFLSNVSLGGTLWEALPGYLIEGQESGNENVMGNLGVTSLGLKMLQIDFGTGQLGWEL